MLWVHTTQLVETGRLRYERRACELAHSHIILMISIVLYSVLSGKLNNLSLTD